ncbi:MAG: S-adenosylmethionine:tRNA ribosyltransferase-isomerase, partial [Candidatus Berkelbacteria bacterium Athens1014_28]
IDLHVGLGTFLPVTEENLSKNKLHYENFSVSKKTIEKILETKKNGGRIIAVGTTTVRALESSAEKILSNKNSDIHSKTEIFIQPGFEFKIVDGLITNFHLPKSSLMMLVAAFLQFKGEKDGQKNC